MNMFISKILFVNNIIMVFWKMNANDQEEECINDSNNEDELNF